MGAGVFAEAHKVKAFVQNVVNRIGLISNRHHALDGYFNVPQKERNEMCVGRKSRGGSITQKPAVIAA